MDISALPLPSATPRSGGPPPTTSDGGRELVLCSVYIIIWLSFVSVYNNQRSISLDYPGQDRLPNWLSGAPQPQCFRRLHACTPSYRIRRADSVASSHSAPLRVLYCIYSESGLFWAISWLSITIYPFHTQCGALSIPLSSLILSYCISISWFSHFPLSG